MIKSITRKSSLECKCIKEHKCPLYIALETFKVANEDQILEHKCDLLRYLIVQGASIKFELKQDQKAGRVLSKWSLKWLDIEGIRNYLITKNFNYLETKMEHPLAVK